MLGVACQTDLIKQCVTELQFETYADMIQKCFPVQTVDGDNQLNA